MALRRTGSVDIPSRRKMRIKRIDPRKQALLWIDKNVDPPGFEVKYFQGKASVKCWGSVSVLKGGEDIALYPVCSTVFAIGSMETNDIVVKTAAAHEVVIEVNRFNEVFIVQSSTAKVRQLKDHEVFEVGGRAFRWVYALQYGSFQPEENDMSFKATKLTEFENCNKTTISSESMQNNLQDPSRSNEMLFGLEDTDLQEVARHMGHELAVHRKFYRLQDDVIELAKISKLLLAVESGKAHQFSGLSIDDIELDQLPSISDEEAITAPLKSKEEEPSVSDENTITASLKSEEELPSVSDEIDVSITAPLKSEEGRPVRNKRIFKPDVFGFDDSDRNKTEDVSSDSDDEVGRRIKKRKKCENEKKVWSECEKKMLMPLVMSSVRDGRPPVKKSILKFKKETSMEKLPWLKIKYQVWAMAQSEMKKNKKITDELGMQ